MGRVPVMAEWIQGKYIVTNAKSELKPGDEIVAINGTAASQVLADAEKLISGASPQWKRAGRWSKCWQAQSIRCARSLCGRLAARTREK